MSFSVPPAFAQAELEYRQQRIKAGYPARSTRPSRFARQQAQRRVRLSALFKPRRRPQPAPRLPLPSPHHLTSR